MKQNLNFKSRFEENKRVLANNTSGVAPIVWVLAIGLSVLGAGVIYTAVQKPDITYNISDPIFSVAGVDMSGLVIIAIVVVSAIVLLLAFRRKPNQ